MVLHKGAESISLKEALYWAKRVNLKKCIFENDSKKFDDAFKGVR